MCYVLFLTFQGINGINQDTYLQHPIEFQSAIKQAIQDLIGDEADTDLEDVQNQDDDQVTDDTYYYYDDDLFSMKTTSGIIKNEEDNKQSKQLKKQQLKKQQSINGVSCSLETSYQVTMSKQNAADLEDVLKSSNATATLTKYLNAYGFMTGTACPGETRTKDISPTPQPTTQQPTSYPTSIPTSNPTKYIEYILYAIQVITI